MICEETTTEIWIINGEAILPPEDELERITAALMADERIIVRSYRVSDYVTLDMAARK